MLTGATSAAQPHSTVDQQPLTMWWLNTQMSSLTARLTHRLTLTYTQPGDTVVSLASDTYAATATLMARRNHITVNAPADLANIPNATSLLTVQWPTRATTADRTVMNDLLLACEIIAGPGPCTVAVIAPTARRHAADDPFPQAFHPAGLRHRIDVVAVGHPGITERFLYHIAGGQVATFLADEPGEPDAPAARVRIFATDSRGSSRRV